MTVSLCPVCQGRGTVEPGFYRTERDAVIDWEHYPTCRSCDGKGIIWSPEAAQKQPSYVPVPYYPYPYYPAPTWPYVAPYTITFTSTNLPDTKSYNTNAAAEVPHVDLRAISLRSTTGAVQ